MEIKNAWRKNADYKLRLSSYDIKALAGMQRESKHQIANDGEMPHISELDIKIGKLATNKNLRVLFIKKQQLREMADGLNGFAQSTPAEVDEIPDTTGIAKYANQAIYERSMLGHHAAAMVLQIIAHEASELTMDDLDVGFEWPSGERRSGKD